MATTYTVKRGDTLSEIALRFGTTVAELVRINKLSNPDYIIVAQVLKLTGDPDPDKENKDKKPVIDATRSGLQSNTERTFYVTWTWSKDHTENYRVIWYYNTGDKVWFVGNDTTEDFKQSIYTPPVNATKIKVKVKANSKTHTVNGKETTYWTSDWSTEKEYATDNLVTETPPVPKVELDKYTLTASVDNVDAKTGRIQFQVVKNNSTVFKSGNANVKTRSASYSCTVDAGAEYKVRCRGFNGTKESEWSDYSENVKTIPAAVASITKCKANSKTSVYLEWTEAPTAETYDIEYAIKREYFDGSNATTEVTGIEFTHYEITGLETGDEYFFRVRAVNEQGETAWSEIKSVAIGEEPAAPTTWSSTTTAVTNEPLNLYWVHNAEDGSDQTSAEIELIIDGESTTLQIDSPTDVFNILVGKVTTTVTVISFSNDDEENDDVTSGCTIDISKFTEGTTIQWRVRTAGVTLKYGEYSMQRTIDVYAPPTLELRLTDSTDNDIDTVTTFPFYFKGLAGPNTQLPIGYHITVTANDSYETVDQVGNVKMVSRGDQVYSRYFDITKSLEAEISANNIDLENNVSYTVTGIVSMNSGLTAESSLEFTVSWADLEYGPDAEISIDEDTLAAHICPYCDDDLAGVTLSVYRREFDGTFTEIATGIENGSYTFVTDPHPALDYARYRIVAIAESTGAVSYYDMPGYPIGEKAAVIQWDEEWSSFDGTSESEMAEPTWSGSMLKLPYNIDVSDSRKVDVALVEYIGRAHPISYYGTQLGETSSWSMEIPKSDKDTLYALRRLSIWKGDVYVREPSGSGYWASISVSFSQTHCAVTIPVNLSITRVEGGI